jgi:glycerol-3-phosphate dehydrogenase
MEQFDVVVIGGGVTGCATARDAAARGLRVLLVERNGVGSGTSGRFHSMLQSGGRYVVTDVNYAAECMRERRIAERLAPFAFEDTKGLFVFLDDDDVAFGDQFVENCRQADIPVQALSSGDVARREPELAETAGGFLVPDAVFKPWLMVPALAQSALDHGATIRTGVEVVDAAEAVPDLIELTLEDRDGSRRAVSCSALVIAAGTWTPRLAARVGQDVKVEVSKGAMLVVPERSFSAVINRCRPPQSFDIAVPAGESTVFGTTSSTVVEPTDTVVTPQEWEQLVTEFARWVPSLGTRTEEWSAYAGVRPLVAQSPGEGGAVSRRHAVIEGGSVPRVFSIIGGSFTTHRAMAEDVVDRVVQSIGVSASCRTADEPLPIPRSVAWSDDAPMRASLFSRGT